MDEDRIVFLEKLRESQEIYQVVLYAWVLMDNHFHLLLETPLGNLDQFMRRFNICYTGYFNRKHKRAGHLYQGRYKSILVEKEGYISVLSRYIHLNPIRVQGNKAESFEEKEKYLFSYNWSTLNGYLDKKKRVAGVDYSLILEEFGGDNKEGRGRYSRRIKEDIGEEMDVKEKIIGGSILGNDDFVSRVKEDLLEGGPDHEFSGARRIKGFKVRERILDTLLKETKRTEEELVTGKGDQRRIAMELLYRLGGLNGVEIGKMFKVSYNAVSQERKRLSKKMEVDSNLKKYFATLLRNLEKQFVTI
jgi:putative transposase